MARALAAADPEGTISPSDPALRRFLGHYEAVMLDTTVPFPGVTTGLTRLWAHAIPMAIVTNKPIEPTERILGALGLQPFFTCVLGGDSVSTKKPHPAMLEHAAAALGRPLGGCLMVGDSDVDMEAAQAAGVPGIWCAWGGIHPDRPDRYDATVSSFDELVEGVLSGRFSP